MRPDPLRARLALAVTTILAAGMLVTACSRQAKQRLEGHYALALANGQSLPFTQSRSLNAPGSCRATVVNAALDIGQDDRFRLSYDGRDACNVNGIVNTVSHSDKAKGVITRNGDVLFFLAGQQGADTIMIGPLRRDTLSLYDQPHGVTLSFVRSKDAAPQTSARDTGKAR